MSCNSPVSVTAVHFNRKCEAIPRRIELDGISYDLHPPYKHIKLTCDEGTTSIFDVSDGRHIFRLRQTLADWRLMSMSSVNA